jgi:hypothetical protein
LYSFDLTATAAAAGDNEELHGKMVSLYVARLGQIDSCIKIKKFYTIDSKLIQPAGELFDLSRLETESTTHREENGLLVQTMFIISQVRLHNMNVASRNECPNPRSMFILDDERLKLTSKLGRTYLLRCLTGTLAELNIYAFLVDKISLRIIKAIEFNLSLETPHTMNFGERLHGEYFKSIEMTTSDLMRAFLVPNDKNKSKNNNNKSSDALVPIYKLNATEYGSTMCSANFPVRFSIDESDEWARAFRIDTFSGQLYYFLTESNNSSFALDRLYALNLLVKDECENQTRSIRFEMRLLNDEPVVKLQNLRKVFVIPKRPMLPYAQVGQLDVFTYLVDEMGLPKSQLNLTFELIDDLKESAMFRLNKRTAHLFISDAGENNENRLYSLRVSVSGNCVRRPIVLILNVLVYQYETSGHSNTHQLIRSNASQSIQFEKSVYEFNAPLYVTNNNNNNNNKNKNHLFETTSIATFQTRAFVLWQGNLDYNQTDTLRSNLYFRSLSLPDVASVCSINSFDGRVHCDMELMTINMCAKKENEFTMTLLTYAFLQSKYVFDLTQVSCYIL